MVSQDTAPRCPFFLPWLKTKMRKQGMHKDLDFQRSKFASVAHHQLVKIHMRANLPNAGPSTSAKVGSGFIHISQTTAQMPGHPYRPFQHPGPNADEVRNCSPV